MRVSEVIEVVKKSIPYGNWENTVDTLKTGNLNNEVTGIVSTFMATINVIQSAANCGSNFIITHEPTFYNHFDDTSFIKENEIYKYKNRLIEKNNISIWRFHDNWHLHKPDGISFGVAQQLGWTGFVDKEHSRIYNIPEIKLSELIQYFKVKMGISIVRYVGELSTKCSRIGLFPGACGGDAQMKFLINNDVDVFICGETTEWQTYEYIRDANAAGIKKAVMVLGHANSEEIGMKYFVDWLKYKIPGVNITFIQAGDPMSIV